MVLKKTSKEGFVFPRSENPKGAFLADFDIDGSSLKQDHKDWLDDNVVSPAKAKSHSSGGWQIELNGRAIAIDSTFFKEPHIILKDGGSRVTGNGGYNNISGEYQLENTSRICFSKMISTKMACPRMELEGEFLEMLQKVDNFNVTGDMLILNKARMAPLARFKVVYLK